jgi:predicted amidohydrolase YtcJ
MRDLLDSGAALALGSDWPIGRYDPRRGAARHGVGAAQA